MNFNPDIRAKLRILRTNYEMFGWLSTLKSGLAYLLGEGQRDRFDERYGVSTALTVEPARAGIADDAARAQAVRYVAVREEVIRHILETLEAELDLRTSSFVDLGCGKGRALIAASWFPFAHVLGVEISPLHCESARDNIARVRASDVQSKQIRCDDIEVECVDAAYFSPPKSDLLVYLYRPFKEAMLTRVLDHVSHLRDTRGCRILVAYCCPVEEFVFENHARFIKLAEHQVISEEHSWNLWECTADRGHD